MWVQILAENKGVLNSGLRQNTYAINTPRHSNSVTRTRVIEPRHKVLHRFQRLIEQWSPTF